MLETPHVLVGAAIATKIPNPLIAIPLALLSHFALEKIPHWNPHLNTETKKYGKLTPQTMRIIVADTTIALISGSIISTLVLPDRAHALTILLACFASALPDIVEAPYFLFKVRAKILEDYIKLQKKLQVDAPVIPGLITQFFVIAGAIWWILT